MDEDPEEYKKAAADLRRPRSRAPRAWWASRSRAAPCPTRSRPFPERAAAGEGFQYSKYFAVGMFRLLELSNASSPPCWRN